MTKWEYQTVNIIGNGAAFIVGYHNWMNEMGEAGWELIAVSDGYGYFRRPKKIVGPTETKAGQGGPSV